MTADQSNIYLKIKGIHVRDIKLSNKSFGMDVFGTEQKILVLFHAMSHVVIRAIAPVTDKDILGARQRGVPVYHVAESPKFIFLANRLDQCLCISMLLQVI